MLGTVITEWEDGAQLCRELLGSKTIWQRVAVQLADMMLYYGFDGEQPR
jgi:mannosyl-glycoprotein endo-beta-N-acetylglucosaminidase